MTFIVRPWRSRKRHPGLRREPSRPRSRPAVEPLEDRVVLSTLFVVPANQANGTNSFATLAAAVAAANHGDTVQIELGSAPGAATVNKVLLIQGDPANSGANAGQPLVDALTLSASGVILQNLKLSTVTIDNGATGEVIRNDNVASITQTAGAAVNGNNTISGNTITGNVLLGNTFGNPAASGDRVLNNVFNSSTAGIVLHAVQDNGVLIQGNMLNDGTAGAEGIRVNDSLAASVSNNVVVLTGSASIGLQLRNLNGSESAQVNSNRIQTNGQGTGIFLAKFPSGDLVVSLANNNLVNNLVAIHIDGDHTTSASALGTVDLGGGPLGSVGGNDFHGFTGAGGHFAITVTNGGMTTSDTVSARNNIFTGTNPAAAISVAAGAGSVNANPPLSANAALVDRIYENFFGRSGNPTTELPVWANRITSPKSLSEVARLLAHSPESLGRIINQGYLVIFGRQPEPGAFRVWLPFLQHHTAEQFFALLFSSPEFQARLTQLVGTTGNAGLDYIQSLYSLLFGRTGSAGEINAWTPFLAQRNGRAKVALAFLTQAFEFRVAVIGQLYAGLSSQPAGRLASIVPDMFNRRARPSSGEVNVWLGLKLNLLDLYATFATAGEFAANG